MTGCVVIVAPFLAHVICKFGVHKLEMRGTLSRIVSFATCAIGATVGAQVTLPPADGYAHPDNRYTFQRTLLFETDLEAGTVEIVLVNGASIEQGSADVIGGSRSIRMPAGSLIEIDSDHLDLRSGVVYEIAYDYRILDPGTGDAVQVTQGKWGMPLEYHSNPSALRPLIHSPEGRLHRQFRFGPGEHSTFALITVDGEVIVDNISVYRHDRRFVRSEPKIVARGFPRLGNYNFGSPNETARFNDLRLEDVEAALGKFDLVNGVNIEHTTGSTAWVDRLRAINPDITLLPYRISFLTQNIENDEPVGGAADIEAIFNSGLAESWIVLNPDGEPLTETIWPDNLQMDHTPLCPVESGYTFNDYMAEFLNNKVFPTGLWDGLHYDQAEFYPNPLLADTINGPLPPIDLDRDGQADDLPFLHLMHQLGFIDYFSKMRRAQGSHRILFGNAGRIPLNGNFLSKLNGWQQELFTPYRIVGNGQWDTDRAAAWYDFIRNYQAASRLALAPQAINVQFTGRGIGEVIPGRLSGHGLPLRVDQLEPADYRRMRLGLTSVLLDDGYFGYDLVDNTTGPQWFDEYAVDEHGLATGAVEDKGYLGQPLGVMTELPGDQTEIFNIDFEDTPQPGVNFGLVQITEDPEEVISGNRSIVASFDMPSDYFVFESDPIGTPLTPGQTYEFIADFRVLDYTPQDYNGGFFIGISANQFAADPFGRSIAYHQDIVGAGQTLTLRTVVKPDESLASAYIHLVDSIRVSVDNIRLLEGSGGVFRRDFERGVVLVNPTPDDVFVSQSQVEGPRGRTGVRRISGTQATSVNTGQPVTTGLTIPSGDGIVLLADPLDAPPPAPPANAFAASRNDGQAIEMSWTPPTGATAAGYLIEYKPATIDEYTEFVSVGPTTELILETVFPGTSYDIRVRAFDYLGELSEATPSIRVNTNGQPDARPSISAESLADGPLVPGAFMSVSGTDLANAASVINAPPYPLFVEGAQVLVNGVPAPIRSVAETRIEFIVPWALDGDNAIVRVRTNGQQSDGIVRPVAAAAPRILTRDEPNALAPSVHNQSKDFVLLPEHPEAMLFRLSDLSPVTESDPAVAGEAVLLIAERLGRTEPPLRDGEAPESTEIMEVATNVLVEIDGQPAHVFDTGFYGNQLNRYTVAFVVPFDIVTGRRTIQVDVDGAPSNIVSSSFTDGATPADVNDDGVVNFSDVITIVLRLGTDPAGTRLDVDGDGEISFRDAVALLRSL